MCLEAGFAANDFVNTTKKNTKNKDNQGLFLKDQDQDLSVKDQDKDKDLSSKDHDQDFKFVIKDSLRTKTRTRTTTLTTCGQSWSSFFVTQCMFYFCTVYCRFSVERQVIN